MTKAFNPPYKFGKAIYEITSKGLICHGRHTSFSIERKFGEKKTNKKKKQLTEQGCQH